MGTSAVVADLMARGFGVNETSVYLSPAPYYHAAPLKWVQGKTELPSVFRLPTNRSYAAFCCQPLGRKVLDEQCKLE